MINQKKVLTEFFASQAEMKLSGGIENKCGTKLHTHFSAHLWRINCIQRTLFTQVEQNEQNIYGMF